MSKRDDPYVKQMADALALVHLTLLSKVSVSPFDSDSRVDFLVKVTGSKGSSRRTFGVIVKGTIDLIESEEQANEKLNAMEKEWKTVLVPMPVCLFLFSVKNNDGFYAWKFEPVIDHDRPRLVSHATFHSKKLDAEAMNEIIDAVERWHEALYKSLVG
jgi:hypothetical protein